MKIKNQVKLSNTHFSRYVLGKMLAASLSVFLLIPMQSHAAGGKCTLNNVAGVYGFTGSGTIFPANAMGLPAGTYAGVGTVQLDESGHWSIPTQTIVLNGVVVQDIVSTGTYTVNQDCTGQITDSVLGPILNMVFVDNRNEVYTIDTPEGVSITTTFKRITRK